MSGFVSRDWRLKESVQTSRRALLAAATRRDTTATMLASPVMLARNQQRADAIDGGGAATPRWLSTLAASEWLRHSSEGYCASTEETGRHFSAKACRTGHKGGSRLPLEVVKRGWLAAATECVSRCAGCERCRFISISLKDRDCRPADLCSYVAAISQLVSRSSAASVRSYCSQLVRSLSYTPSRTRLSAVCSPVPCRDNSWFNACDQHRLQLDVSSFRSGSVLGNASAQEWGALGERIAAHSNTERDELDRLQLRANQGEAVLERVPTPVPPPATLFLGVISGDVKRRRRPAPTPPCARHAALPHTAANVAALACAQGDGSFDAPGGASSYG